jgi:hypothetical protein
MASPRTTKGKIAHGDWPQILEKYAAGQTIAQIGREYGCTAPAIRYIIKRSGRLKDRGGDHGPSGRVLQRRPSGPSTSPASGRAAGRVLSQDTSADGRRTSARLFGLQLLTRVSGDVVSFLAALDDKILDGSPESVAALQDAIDALMRSAARTCIELGRILNRDDAGTLRKGGAPQQFKTPRRIV